MKKGFTLIELLITMLIVSVLASIAYPGYTKSVLKNEANQAITYLRAIRLAEKMYYAKNATYLACANATAIQSNLGVALTTQRYTFAVTSSPSTTFIATATRSSDSKTIILNQNGAWTGTYTPLPTV